MQTERNKKTAAFAAWALTIACMAVIFWLSSRNAVESAAQSGAVLHWLKTLLGDNGLTDFLVRKGAHCLEFTGLCVLFNTAFYFTKAKPSLLLSIACTSLYAVTDELHQLFVPGRSCQFSDWLIDTGGAALGALGFWLIYTIFTAWQRQKKAKND